MTRRIAATAIAAFVIATGALAQGASLDLPAGMLVKNGRYEVMKIIRCGPSPDYGYPLCWFETYREGQKQGGAPWMSAEQMLKQINSVRDEEGLPPLSVDQASGRAPYPENAVAARPTAAAPRPTTGPRPSIPATAQVRTNPVAPIGPVASAQCPRTPYVDVPGTQPATIAMLRQVMASGHTFPRSAYLWTGVTFESFAVGAAVRNKVTMRPGYGPERVTDAAPVDTALYPVTATYVLCNQYSSGPDRTRIRTGNYCFVSRTGKWACGRDDAVAKTVTTPLG